MRETVLFVDDVPAVTAALKRRLRGEPFRILEAPAAARALEILADEPVDVVVSDEAMPGMTGSELCARIFERHPGVLCIILTGYPTVEAAMRAINDARVYRFMTKPCDPAELADVIRQALQERALIAENRRLARDLMARNGELRELEAENPGITQVRRDVDGAIILD
jgi:two-component system, probable response regulator PhcQ